MNKEFKMYDEVELIDGRRGTIVLIVSRRQGIAIDFGEDWDVVDSSMIFKVIKPSKPFKKQ